MKAAKEHKPQQSRVIPHLTNKSVKQLQPWISISSKNIEFDLETGNIREEGTKAIIKDIKVPDMFKVENIKAASKNANGIGSLYFEKEDGVKEQRRIRFVHKSGPQASGIHKDVHWEVIDNHIYEFEGLVATVLRVRNWDLNTSIEEYLKFTTDLSNKSTSTIEYNEKTYITDAKTANKIENKKLHKIKDLNFHKSRGVPLIWNGSTQGEEIKTNGPVHNTTTDAQSSGIKQAGIDALYRAAYVCKEYKLKTSAANELMYLTMHVQITNGNIPIAFNQGKAMIEIMKKVD